MDTKPETPAAPPSEKPRRVIKRYSNRKLYDTKDSRYVTLLQIAEMVRGGEEVQIIDNNTKDDLTEVTLAQIIYEEQKAHSRNVPLQTLKELIHERTEKVLAELREGPIGRLIPGGEGRARRRSRCPRKTRRTRSRRLVDQAKETLEELAAQDRRADRRRFSPSFRPLAAAPARGQAPERACRGAREASSRAAAERRSDAAPVARRAIGGYIGNAARCRAFDLAGPAHGARPSR